MKIVRVLPRSPSLQAPHSGAFLLGPTSAKLAWSGRVGPIKRRPERPEGLMYLFKAESGSQVNPARQACLKPGRPLRF